MKTPQEIQSIIESAYYVLGFLVFTSLSSLVAGTIFIVKKAVWLAKLEFRIEKLETDLNEAFKKIRDEEIKIKEAQEMKKTLIELSEILVKQKS